MKRKMMYTIWALGTIAILSSVLVISAKNPVHSVLALVAAYGATCGIMVLLGVEFLALLFMIVYVGAIAILFLFVVMMLNIKLEELKDNATRYVPIGLIIGLVFIVEVLIILESDISFVAPLDAPFNFLPLSNIQTIGQILYTDYWLLMIVASLILLVAMIGAIVLTLQQQQNETSSVRRQDIFGQISTSNQLWA
jgi:NADH-quinone oxidoreductase subunit J